MGILFKTYNGKPQIHLYKEQWVFSNKPDLDKVLNLIPKESADKIKVGQEGNNIVLDLNGVIIDCKDMKDMKDKFSKFADFKEEYQKIELKKNNKDKRKRK